MSLILDALRKAEAERKLGRAPTLGTVSPWRVQRRVPLYALLLILLLGVIAVLAGMLWLARRPPPAAVTQVQAPARPSAAPVASRSDTGQPATPERVVEPAPAAAAPPASPSPKPGKPEVARTPPPSERLPTVVPSGPPVPHLEPERSPPAAPAAGAPRNVLPELPKPRPETEAPVPAPEPTAPAPPPPASQPAAAAPTPAPPASMNAHLLPAGPPSAAARGALGELKLTLHYYNPEPPRRFVILDGERYGEGQSSTKGMKVTEIRPDGVVCEYQGELFFLPRAGG